MTPTARLVFPPCTGGGADVHRPWASAPPEDGDPGGRPRDGGAVTR
ncbi:hypothetical protein [Streptomyces sp. NPDC006193]